jgi:hypothetical protein
MLIGELQVEDCIQTLSNEPLRFEQQLETWLNWQPHIAAYILSDSFSLLNDAEKEAFLFGATVLTSLAIKHNITKEQVSQEEIGEIEEANWELLEGQNAKTLSQKMDVFFKDYPEEELLVFIEDLCADEEEEDITGPGAELMVIGLKTIADALFLPANY